MHPFLVEDIRQDNLALQLMSVFRRKSNMSCDEAFSVIRWVVNTANTYGIDLGVHEVSFHQGTQTQEFMCYGCNTVAHSTWRNSWKLDFKHEDNCMYMKMMDISGKV